MRYYTTLIAGILGILMLAVVAQGADQVVKLAWDANTEPDLVGYNLEQAENPEGPWSKINTEGFITATEYNVIYTEPTDTVKYFRVIASDGRNYSGPSNVVTTDVDTIAPATPGTLKIIVDGSVSLYVSGDVNINN